MNGLKNVQGSTIQVSSESHGNVSTLPAPVGLGGRRGGGEARGLRDDRAANGQGGRAGGRRASPSHRQDRAGKGRSRQTAWSVSRAQHLWGMETVQAPRWRECVEIQLTRKRMEDVGGFLTIESLMPVPEQVGISWCMLPAPK